MSPKRTYAPNGFDFGSIRKFEQFTEHAIKHVQHDYFHATQCIQLCCNIAKFGQIYDKTFSQSTCDWRNFGDKNYDAKSSDEIIMTEGLGLGGQ